jgi:hypothetical protein
VSAPYAAGTHNLTADCGYTYDGAMVGFNGTIPTSSGAPVTGAAVLFADSTLDAESGSYTGYQALFVTKTKAATKGQLKKGAPFGWAFYYNEAGNGTEYLGNYGFLTAALGNVKTNYAGAPKTSFAAALDKK